MMWMLCWAEMLEEYARTLAKPTQRSGPVQNVKALPPRRKPQLRLVAVDGVLIQRLAHR